MELKPRSREIGIVQDETRTNDNTQVLLTHTLVGAICSLGSYKRPWLRSGSISLLTVSPQIIVWSLMAKLRRHLSVFPATAFRFPGMSMTIQTITICWRLSRVGENYKTKALSRAQSAA